MPLYLGGGLAALAVIGVILAIVALANQKEERRASGEPVALGGRSAADGGRSRPRPRRRWRRSRRRRRRRADADGDRDARAVADHGPRHDGSTFPGWTGQDGDYTVIIESSSSQSSAESVAQEAQDAGQTVGILNSDDYSSLNSGYWVVFSGKYATEDEAEAALDGLKSDYSDAYVRQIST